MAAQVESLHSGHIPYNDENTLPIDQALDETEPDTPDEKITTDLDQKMDRKEHSTSHCSNGPPDSSLGTNNTDKKNYDANPNEGQGHQHQGAVMANGCQGEPLKSTIETAKLYINDDEETQLFREDEATLVFDDDHKTLEIESHVGEDRTLTWSESDQVTGADELANAEQAQARLNSDCQRPVTDAKNHGSSLPPSSTTTGGAIELDDIPVDLEQVR